MAFTTAVVTTEILFVSENIESSRQYASTSEFPSSLAIHLAALASLDESKKEQLIRESGVLLSCKVQTEDPVQLLNNVDSFPDYNENYVGETPRQHAHVQPSYDDFQLFPSPSLKSLSAKSHCTTWPLLRGNSAEPINPEHAPAKSSDGMADIPLITAESLLDTECSSQRELCPPTSPGDDQSDSYGPIEVAYKPLSSSERTFVRGDTISVPRPGVEEIHRDQGLGTDPAMSYPTPVSNPSDTPRQTNNIVESVYKSSSHNLRHVDANSTVPGGVITPPNALSNQPVVPATPVSASDSRIRSPPIGSGNTFLNCPGPSAEAALDLPSGTESSNSNGLDPNVEGGGNEESQNRHSFRVRPARKRKLTRNSGATTGKSSSKTLRPSLQRDGFLDKGQPPTTHASLDVDEDLPSAGPCPTSPGLRLSNKSVDCPLELAFSKLTPKKLDEVRDKGDRLLVRNCPEFLEKHTQVWRTTGFWDQPSVTFRIFPTHLRNTVFNYVEALQAQGETNFIKLRLGRVLLYLQYIRETEWKRRRGIREGRVKSEAINSLLELIETTEGGRVTLDPEAKDKIRGSFHLHKRLAERWWWLASFVGLGVLLVCSEETGNKVNNPNFPIDALIAYILNDRAGDVAFCREFDDIVVTLLTAGQFSREYTREEVRSLIDRAKQRGRAAAATLTHWRLFDTDVAASGALAFLHEWADHPGNCLVTLSDP